MASEIWEAHEFIDVLKPLKQAARMIEHSIHLQARLDSVVEDGVELLHTIEQTENGKLSAQGAMKKRRRLKKKQ